MSSASGTPETADREVLSTVCGWLHEGRRVALVTVLRTWGGSPRPPGALMAIADDGGICGSVSGGCVEQDLVRRFRARELAESYPTIVELGAEGDQTLRLGLPCGGRLELLVEELDAADPLEIVLAQIDAGALVARRVCLSTGEASLHDAAGRRELNVDNAAVTRVFGRTWHLLLIGDGQIARYLAAMALMLDYRVTICDPRDVFADPDPLAGVRYTRRMPDEAVRALADDPRSAIVTLAHDPRQDDLALVEALTTSNAFYVGALGSRRTAEARSARLRRVGLSAEQIARLDAPAGVSIGSKRPGEIALSILAGITAARNRLGSVETADRPAS